eukprot:2181222-Ditylum_brightwellii.AAC.1
MSCHTETSGDEDIPYLISNNTTAPYDILILSQARPKKITTAQNKIHNRQHHGHHMTMKDKNTLQLYFQN